MKTENSYSDENISITIKEYREYDTTIYVADITVNSSEYLKTALANNSYGKNVTEKTSEMAEFMRTLGVQTAYNLDGGGSSTLYFNGEVINQPTTTGRTIEERSVSDIVYIGY